MRNTPSHCKCMNVWGFSFRIWTSHTKLHFPHFPCKRPSLRGLSENPANWTGWRPIMEKNWRSFRSTCTLRNASDFLYCRLCFDRIERFVSTSRHCIFQFSLSISVCVHLWMAARKNRNVFITFGNTFSLDADIIHDFGGYYFWATPPTFLLRWWDETGGLAFSSFQAAYLLLDKKQFWQPTHFVCEHGAWCDLDTCTRCSVFHNQLLGCNITDCSRMQCLNPDQHAFLAGRRSPCTCSTSRWCSCVAFRRNISKAPVWIRLFVKKSISNLT